MGEHRARFTYRRNTHKQTELWLRFIYSVKTTEWLLLAGGRGGVCHWGEHERASGVQKCARPEWACLWYVRFAACVLRFNNKKGEELHISSVFESS